jgi:hypothetical protein
MLIATTTLMLLLLLRMMMMYRAQMQTLFGFGVPWLLLLLQVE